MTDSPDRDEETNDPGVHDVRIEREMPAEPPAVFVWLVEPTLLTRWWPTEAEADAQPGGSYRMHWAGPDVTLRGEYVAVEPYRRLVFTWSWDHDDLPARTVDMCFEPSAGGTTITIEHEAETVGEANDYRDGWTHFLGRLAAALAAS